MRNALFSVSLLGFLLLAGCDTGDPNTVNRSELLTSGRWQLQEAEVLRSDSLEKEDLKFPSYYDFEENGTVRIGPSGQGGEPTAGEWHLTHRQSDVFIEPDGSFTTAHDILELTEERLHVQYLYPLERYVEYRVEDHPLVEVKLTQAE